jgi:hypothetical protein
MKEDEGVERELKAKKYSLLNTPNTSSTLWRHPSCLPPFWSVMRRMSSGVRVSCEECVST